jgi:hypothetical protein
VVLSVTNQATSVITKFNVIVKICKYKRIHKGHHFIPMAMEVHNTSQWDMDHFIGECAHLFHDRQSKVHFFCFFAFNFSGNLLVLLFNVL